MSIKMDKILMRIRPYIPTEDWNYLVKEIEQLEKTYKAKWAKEYESERCPVVPHLSYTGQSVTIDGQTYMIGAGITVKSPRHTLEEMGIDLAEERRRLEAHVEMERANQELLRGDGLLYESGDGADGSDDDYPGIAVDEEYISTPPIDKSPKCQICGYVLANDEGSKDGRCSLHRLS